MNTAFCDFVAAMSAIVEADYWSARPAVRRGLFSDPGDFIAADHLEQMLDPAAGHVAVVLRQKMLAPHEADTRSSIAAQVGNGATVVLYAIQRSVPHVASACASLTAASGRPVFCNAYMTPASNQGFERHWDIGSVVVVGLQGRKTWYVGEPVVTSLDELVVPYVVRGYSDEERRRSSVLVETLEAGDVMFLPRGWTHCARTADSGSLHASFGVIHSDTDLQMMEAVYP